MAVKNAAQRKADADRKYFELTFPADMSEKAIHAFIRSIGKNLRSGSAMGVPTMVFELWARPEGITHRLRVPSDAAPYLIGQLQSALPGMDVQEVVRDIDVPNKSLGFQFGATLHMQNHSEELPIASNTDYSNRILASLQSAREQHDTICVQWVIAHSPNQKYPPSDRPVDTQRKQGLIRQLIFGVDKRAGRDEVKTRRQKQFDQNYIATARIAARGKKVERAEALVRQVVRAYTSEGGYAHFYAKGADYQQISRDIRLGTTPIGMTAQLNVKELGSVIAWPMDDTYVPGLNRGTTRHMPAPETVARKGRVFGESTMPGIDRQIAQDYSQAITHTYIAGGTGVGKTTLMVNTIRQDMETGAGVILIEREGNLFQQALDQVPPKRMKDVICIDLTRSDRPVGLNLLRTNRPEIVAGQLAALLQALYPDMKSLNVNQIVLHAIPVLANLERATVADLIPLALPRGPVEKAWAKAAVAKMTDRIYREFWDDWYAKLDGKESRQIETNVQPLKNRMFELMTPEPSRYLLNQETSSFEPADVVRGNKLLFVNLAGVSEQVASLIGTMIVTAIWTAAKQVKPTKPNFMYLDEFQRFSYLSQDFEDMLAEARKNNLGLVIATQYIERLKPATQDAVMTNARTKIIFQTSTNSASIHARDFASRAVTSESFMNLKAHQALARINTPTGLSEPITLRTFSEPEGFNKGSEILELSARKYGRDRADINRDDERRRIAPTKPPAAIRKDIGWSNDDEKQVSE